MDVQYRDLQAQAKEILGLSQDDDFKIKPTTFPQSVEKKKEFSELLAHSSLQGVAKRYEEHDSEAVKFQTNFKKDSKFITYLLFVSAIFGIAQTNLSMFLDSSLYQFLSYLFPTVATILSGIAVYKLNRINGQGWLTRWMKSRAQAEAERLKYFQRAMTKTIDKHSENKLMLVLYCEFFHRFQMQIQLKYYRQQSKVHRKTSSNNNRIASFGAMTIFIGSGVLGFLGAVEDPKWLPLAAIGTLGTAISLLASRSEEITMSSRNAERYNDTWNVLSKLSDRHDEVIEAIANGQTNALTLYVDAVHQVLIAEHKQWLQDGDTIQSSMQKLTNELKQKG